MAFHLKDGWLLSAVRRSLSLESVIINRIPAEQGNMPNLLRPGLRAGQRKSQDQLKLRWWRKRLYFFIGE